MSEASNKKPKTGIKILEEILFPEKPFIIPPYQRPYKWSTKNVNQLIDDLLLHSDKPAYRLGTVVLHRNDLLEVVDGQQRLLTLSLLAAELLNTDAGRKLIKGSAENLCLANAEITHPLTIENLKRNHLLIQSRLKEFSEDDTYFFFKQCELVYVELKDISEAFQFFDSQNTRGKDLEPHDLLKAFHLREMESDTQLERVACVNPWEKVSEELPNFFSNYLFRIRRWSKGKSGLFFSKKHIDTFKGLTFNGKEDNFKYASSYRINHFFVDNYNRDSVRNIDSQLMAYPFQLDNTIVNGKRFFEFTHHYASFIRQIEDLYKPEYEKCMLYKRICEGREEAKSIIDTLNEYNGKGRSGDMYVRNLFDCCMLYYWDKFGFYKFDEAIVRFFTWAFKLRLEQKPVKAVSADNLAINYSGYFRMIREAVHPNDIIRRQVIPAKYIEKDSAKHLGPIARIFEKLNALEK